MKYEVIEKATGAKMSRSKSGEMMGSTIFDSKEQAETWLKNVELTTETHTIKEIA